MSHGGFLVTGGHGFIGSNLARRLEVEGKTAVLSRPGGSRWRLAGLENRIQTVEADIRDYETIHRAFARLRPEIVFHCAMPHGHPRTPDQRREFLDASVMGTVNVLEAAIQAGATRLVHLGSSLVYGPQARPLHEDDPMDPPTARGAAKAGAAIVVRQWAAAASLSTIELRLFSVYGPWEASSRFVPRLLSCAADGSTLPLCRGPKHDWVFVGDVVEACLKAVDSALGPGEVINIGSGELTDNDGVVAAASAATGRPIAAEPGGYQAGPQDAAPRQADISAARTRLGWAPRHSLAEGLAASYDWQKRFR